MNQYIVSVLDVEQMPVRVPIAQVMHVQSVLYVKGWGAEINGKRPNIY